MHLSQYKEGSSFNCGKKDEGNAYAGLVKQLWFPSLLVIAASPGTLLLICLVPASATPFVTCPGQLSSSRMSSRPPSSETMYPLLPSGQMTLLKA